LLIQHSARAGLWEGTSPIPNPANLENRTTTAVLLADYGLTPDWTVALALPYRFLQARMPTGVEVTTQGFGDLSTYAKYVLVDEVDFQAFLTRRLLLLMGVIWPTGVSTSLGPDGTELPLTLQPGAGAFGGQVGVAFFQAQAPFSWYADVTATARTEGRGYRVGPALIGNLAANYQVADALFLVGEVNIHWQSRDQVGIQGVSGTGGETLTVSPGMQWTPWRGMVIEGALRIPVYQRVNDQQLGQSVAPVGGVHFTFP